MKRIIYCLLILLQTSIIISCYKEDDNQSLVDYCIDKIYVPLEESDFNTFLINRAKFNCYDANHYGFVFIYQYGGCINNELYLEVLNDSIINTEIIKLDQFTPITSVCIPETIEAIFELISDAVDKNTVIPRILSLCDPVEFPFTTTCELADKVRIEYDTTYGFPSSVFIDYNSGWADEEYRIQLRDFEILK